METAAISYRVADFLKKHPPFHAIDEADLVGLAARGRVKFHEANDFVLWQGEPHRAHIFVIQQGTVSLWDEAGGRTELRDILGTGDMLGIERFNGAPRCAHSARAGSDVVLYTFPAEDFADLLERYPYARQYVAAHSGVTVDYQPADARHEPQQLLLHDLVGRKELYTCMDHDSIREAACQMVTSGADAIAVVDREHRARAVLTPHDVLGWIAGGGGDVDQPITCLLQASPSTVPPDAAVTEGVLAMAASRGGALAITTDGTVAGRLLAVVTARDVAPVFGDQPVSVLREVGLARNLDDLRALNQRARAFALQHLSGTTSLDWLVRFAHATDVSIVRRIIALTNEQRALSACWCFCGPAGREESLTLAAPWPVMILHDDRDRGPALAMYRHVLDALADCGYLAPPETPFDPSFYVASVAEWKTRYSAWVRDPIVQQLYKARPLFDLRAIHGAQSLWQEIVTTVGEVVDRDFLHILANDCLANLPPLTFFQDAVVEETGELAAVFRLEESVLCPLVDVGRVFGMAARAVLGRSTLERLVMARSLFPEHESIFRDAAETLRIVLWQQGRVGIRQGTDGSELPPTLLSRQDRHLLKGGFRSVVRLLEFTADRAWIGTL